MASISTSSGWMTNFIYEQDLTSAYMNNLLYSIFRPGVYNANMYLTTGKSEESTSGTAELLKLNIKKGTTLVFSNDYKYVNKEQGFRRNFIGYNKDVREGIIEQQIPVLIKCTALRDISVTVAKSYNASNKKDMSLVKWLGSSDTKAPESLYVTTFIRYWQDSTDVPTAKSYSIIPSFCLTRNNPFYGDESKDAGFDSEASKFFYYHTGELYSEYSTSGDENWYWRLPDGSTHYGGKIEEQSTANQGHLDMMPKFSYLMLGALLDNNPWKNSDESKEYKEFSPDWMRYHTFSGRCLPEYRHHLIGDSNNESPDFIIPMKFKGSLDSTKFSRLYIDFKKIINYGTLYDKSIDWESAYNVTNNSLFEELDGQENIDYIDYAFSDKDKSDLINKINVEKHITKDVLIADFTFVSSRSFLNDEYQKDETITVDNIFSYNTSLSLFNHREILFNASNIQYHTDSIDTIGNALNCTFVHSSDKESSLSNTEIALDISDLNNERLYNLIMNNNILSRIINKVRKENELNPKNGESLIPVAVAFRLMTISKEYFETSDTTRQPGKTYYIKISDTEYQIYDGELESGKTYYELRDISEEKITAPDGITSFNSVNPLNVLSLLDLSYKMNKLSPILTRTQDAYNILTVIK